MINTTNNQVSRKCFANFIHDSDAPIPIPVLVLMLFLAILDHIGMATNMESQQAVFPSLFR